MNEQTSVIVHRYKKYMDEVISTRGRGMLLLSVECGWGLGFPSDDGTEKYTIDRIDLQG